MERLTFFPTPYPDECYYSIFCRYFARSASLSNERTIHELFGKSQSLAAFVFMPRRLDLASTWLDKESGISREKLAYQHSAYPYFSITFPTSMMQDMEKIIQTGEANRNLERRTIQKCRIKHWPEYLRYCPGCVRDDLEEYGETYWHRLPQLPGVKYCPRHFCLIQNSGVRLKDTTMAFLPASYALRSAPTEIVPQADSYKERYLQIAADTVWLLKHGHKMGGCREIAAKYREIMIEKKLATVQGVTYRNRVLSALIQYHGEGFLSELLSENANSFEWIEYFCSTTSGRLHPLHHVLIMECLCGSVRGFYCAEPHNKPYGTGPWPCVNKICEHYGKDGVQEVSVEYVNGRAVGYFTCSFCGMAYRCSRPERSFTEYVQHVKILDYGNLWRETLRNYAEVQQLSLREITSRMKCSAYTARTYGKKIGLPPSIITQWESNPTGNHKHPLRNPSQYYRQKVEETLKTHPELTVKELQTMVPGAYSWFHKNDFQWLKERLVTDQEKQYWVEWEKQQLEALKNAYETIQRTGDPDRRVTIGWLCTIIGLRESEIKGRLHRFPSIRAFIEEVVESKEAWLRRRITAIAQERALIGERLRLSDIKRVMSIKPNTYKKYASYMERLIDELNRTSFEPT